MASAYANTLYLIRNKRVYAKTDVVRFCFLLGTRRSRHHRISLKVKSLRKSDVLSDVFSGLTSPPFPRPPPLKAHIFPEYNIRMKLNQRFILHKNGDVVCPCGVCKQLFSPRALIYGRLIMPDWRGGTVLGKDGKIKRFAYRESYTGYFCTSCSLLTEFKLLDEKNARTL